MHSASAAVSVEGLTHRYHGKIALDDVTLSIPFGSTTAIVGPDGVGKSTLLGVISGARRIQAGQVFALGGDMASASHRMQVSSRIAYMPQGLGRNLYPTLTVAENVDFFGRLFGVPKTRRRERMERLFAATGLWPYPDRPAGKLSGGMKQKLALCCALVHDPDLLVLDEPTTGVDPLSRRQFWRFIDEMRATRPDMAVLVATAYMDEANQFERIVAMDEGKVLLEGARAEALARYGTSTVEEAYVALLRPERRGPPTQQTPAYTDHGGPPVIRTKGLTRRFGDFIAVNNVSFEIRRGEIFGFLGPNGCGKTTTMKMLTGLLPADAGEAELLGSPVNAQDINNRMRIGYVSQGFSLYEELTVRANLELHGRLFQIGEDDLSSRVNGALERFDLRDVADARPSAWPLGMRQRLQLAAACLHKPEILILDEPTAGVDPGGREKFWSILLDLSRRESVTIFISTHFMTEAERCDRVSMMETGRVLAIGTPRELCEAKGVESLEAAFIAYLQESAAPVPTLPSTRTTEGCRPAAGWRIPPALSRTLAFTWREGLEILRDKVRLSFAVFVPVLLMMAFGYGISFDIERVKFAVLDRDQSAESRALVEHFSSSRYFVQRPPLQDEAAIDRLLLAGELRFAMSIPPGFGRDLLKGIKPEVSFWLEGGNTFPAEIARAYIQGTMLGYESDQQTRQTRIEPSPVIIVPEPRFRYNQTFRSVVAIAPGAVMLLLIVVPAMLTAVGVVREKELGSITNVYASPTRVLEFLIGKQIPYFLIGVLSYIVLLLLTSTLFDIQPAGSVLALSVAAAIYIFSATSFGLFVSAFVRTQVAAVFATAIATAMTAAHYSGFLFPASTLEGAARVMGLSFPSLWFQTISLGVLSKGLGARDLLPEFAALIGFSLLFLLLARVFVRKQGA